MPPYAVDTTASEGRRQAVVTVLFVLLGGVLFHLPGQTQRRVAGVLRGTVLLPFVLTQDAVVGAREQATDARVLRARLDSLIAVTTSTTTLADENRRLRDLLALRARTGPAYRAASVVRPGTAGSESMFLLDVGSEAGVLGDAPVITREGLVGRVLEVGPTTSSGIDWTHPDFAASAMTRDGTTFGMVESRRGDFREEDRLVLRGTVFHTRLPEGTEVVTSGLGGVYPRGIPIGSVAGLAEAEAGWEKSYWLEPHVPVGGVTHVLVATADTVDLLGIWSADSTGTSTAVPADGETSAEPEGVSPAVPDSGGVTGRGGRGRAGG